MRHGQAWPPNAPAGLCCQTRSAGTDSLPDKGETMPAHDIATPRLSNHLAEPLRVGEPDIHGPLAVFPTCASAPVLESRAAARRVVDPPRLQD